VNVADVGGSRRVPRWLIPVVASGLVILLIVLLLVFRDDGEQETDLTAGVAASPVAEQLTESEAADVEVGDTTDAGEDVTVPSASNFSSATARPAAGPSDRGDAPGATATPRPVVTPEPAAAPIANSSLKTVVSSSTVEPGLAAYRTVNCPAGTVATGGGVDAPPGPNLTPNDITVTASAPYFGSTRLISRADGTNPAASAWLGAVRNNTAQNQTFKVSVTCAPVPGLSTLVVSKSLAADGGLGGKRADCPGGRVAVGGGVDNEDLFRMSVVTTLPVVGNDPLNSLADGKHGAPTGWQAVASNTSDQARTTKIAVLCAPVTKVKTMVASGNSPAESWGFRLGECDGGLALSGGLDTASPTGMRTMFNGPIFGDGTRLYSKADGPAPSPSKWYSGLRNETNAAAPYKVGIVCSEE
jgi:hypothetical protein